MYNIQTSSPLIGLAPPDQTRQIIFINTFPGSQSYLCGMGNRLIGIGSSGKDRPISGGRASKLDENSKVFGRGTLPEEDFRRN